MGFNQSAPLSALCSFPLISRFDTARENGTKVWDAAAVCLSLLERDRAKLLTGIINRKYGAGFYSRKVKKDEDFFRIDAVKMK